MIIIDGNTYESTPADTATNLVKAVFVILLLVTIFLPIGVVSTFYVAVIFICLHNASWKIKSGLLSLLSPLFLLFVLGIIHVYWNSFFVAMKDVWYLLKVVFTLCAGYLLMHHLKSIYLLCRLVVLAAVIASMIHLLNSMLSYQSGFSIMDLRDDVGGGSSITFIGLSLLVGVRQARKFIGLNVWLYYLSIMLCAGSLILSGSRTYIFSFAVMFLIMSGWRMLSLKTFFILLPLGIAIFVAILSTNSAPEGRDLTLISKFANSTSEMNVRDYDSMKEINLNWRGFEAYRAYVTYMDGSIAEKAFGQGFGALIDLGFFMKLGESEFRFIPVLHNGFMYVLVKYGFFGLLTYLYFIFKLIRFGRKETKQQRFDLIIAVRFISSLGWVILFTSMVISGVFNLYNLDSSLIIIGAVVAWFQLHNGRKILSSRSLV